MIISYCTECSLRYQYNCPFKHWAAVCLTRVYPKKNNKVSPGAIKCFTLWPHHETPPWPSAISCCLLGGPRAQLHAPLRGTPLAALQLVWPGAPSRLSARSQRSCEPPTFTTGSVEAIQIFTANRQLKRYEWNEFVRRRSVAWIHPQFRYVWFHI